MPEQIEVWVQDSVPEGKSAMPGMGLLPRFRTVKVDREKVHAGIQEMIRDFGSLVHEGTDGYQVAEIEIALAVTASGGVQLLGKAEVGAQASLKVKLTRSPGS